MKKLVSIIMTVLISCVTVFVLTLFFGKKIVVDSSDKNTRDSTEFNTPEMTQITDIDSSKIVTIQDTTNILVEKNKVSENEIIEAIEKAQLYLGSLTKTKDMLTFHRTRLNNLYKIVGLSDETNQLLRSTIIKLNDEIKKMDKVPSEDMMKNDTINSN